MHGFSWWFLRVKFLCKFSNSKIDPINFLLELSFSVQDSTFRHFSCIFLLQIHNTGPQLFIFSSGGLKFRNKSFILSRFELKLKLLLLKFKIKSVYLWDKIFVLIFVYTFKLLNFFYSKLSRTVFECILIASLSIKVRKSLIFLNLFIIFVFIDSLPCNILIIIWRNILQANSVNREFKLFERIHQIRIRYCFNLFFLLYFWKHSNQW